MQKISRPLMTLLFNHLPRSHRIVLGSLIFLTLAGTVWRPYVYSPFLVRLFSRIISSEEHALLHLSPKDKEPLNNNISSENDIHKDEWDKKIAGEVGAHEYVVCTGDTFKNILTKYGIDAVDIRILVQQYPVLRNIKIGQTLFWRLTDEGILQHLTWKISRREIRTYDRATRGFKENIANMSSKWRTITFSGKLNGNFMTSIRGIGLSGSDVNAVIKALQWQLDFRKLQKGDQFAVLTAWEVVNSKETKSQLIGVRLCTSGKNFYAFRADDGKFYNREAAGLAQRFMRFPTIKMFRVSSNFNPYRLNPVTGRITPHRGVDFAVPVGTPVLAIGDGEVMVSQNGGAAGNYVAIRHGRQYMTRYMHLKKLLVKPGQKVKCGEQIALSGNTGRSTAPHLHFEVWINQKAVNPLTAKLPRAEGLMGSARAKYLAHVKQMLPRLQLN